MPFDSATRFRSVASYGAVFVFGGLVFFGLQKMSQPRVESIALPSSSSAQDVESLHLALEDVRARLSELDILESDLQAALAKTLALQEGLENDRRHDRAQNADDRNVAARSQVDTGSADISESSSTGGYDQRVEAAWAETDAYFASLDREYYAEAVDPSWSGEAVRTVQNAFQQSEGLQNAMLDGVDCRGVRCKLELTLDETSSNDVEGDIEFAIAENLAGSMQGMAIYYHRDYGTGGPKKATIYLSRSGYPVERN